MTSAVGIGPGGLPIVSRCATCGKEGHNSRTCTREAESKSTAVKAAVSKRRRGKRAVAAGSSRSPQKRRATGGAIDVAIAEMRADLAALEAAAAIIRRRGDR